MGDSSKINNIYLSPDLNILGTLCHNGFRNRAATLFNCLPKHIRNYSELCQSHNVQEGTGQSSVFNRRLSYGVGMLIG